MDVYIVTLTILGVVILLTAWLPMVLKRLPLSLPIICESGGAKVGHGSGGIIQPRTE
jgi:hypothetical protein